MGKLISSLKMFYLYYSFGKKAFLFLFFIIVFLTVNAQFKQIGLKEGLSNNSITTIYQDGFGYMWIGTFDGLNRYDGYQFKVFKNSLSDSLSLPNNRISAIEEDGAGNLWVGTKMGMYRLDKSKWSFFPLYYKEENKPINPGKKITNPINAVLKAPSGNLLICTAGEGVLVQELNTDKAMQIPLKREGQLVYRYHAQAVVIDRFQAVWVFVQNVGLTRYNVATGSLEIIDRSVWHANCMMADKKGNIWIGNNNGLHRLQELAGKTLIYTYYTHIGNQPIMSISADKQGKIWVGSDGGGVFQIDSQANEIKNFIAGDGIENLSSAAVYTIYVDNSDRKWIGTLRGGVNILDKTANRFQLVQRRNNQPQALSSNFILSFCEQDSNQVWIGTDGAGLTQWCRSTNTFRSYKQDPQNTNSLSNNNVVNIVKDEENLWIATYGGGINKFNLRTGKFKRYRCFNTVYQYEEANVWALYRDSKGDIWAGTLSDGGFYRFNKKEDYFELVDHLLTNLLTITEDESGQLWGGNFNSLIKIDLQTKRHSWFHVGSAIRAIKPDKNGKLWLGTEGKGLMLFDKKKRSFKTYTEHDGLPENAVLNILEDDNNHLWLSTFNGLSEFSLQNNTFRNFFVADGLQSNQFNYNAALKLSTGELLFGGINGFNIFLPQTIKSLKSKTPLWITDIRINNKPIEGSDLNISRKELSKISSLQLPHDRAVLSVDFAALDYSFQDKINYAFYLEGWEDNWNYVGHTRSANYGKLPPGKYVLHIKASDADGQWLSNERLLYIQVSPPWWATWWAYFLYGIILLLIVASYNRYKRNSLQLKYEVEKAKMEQEKEHELNEKKIAFFTHVSHELRTPLTLIINPIKALLTNEKIQDVDVLQGIYRNSKRLLSMVNQLLLFKKAESELDSLKVVQLNPCELCQEIYQCYQQQAKLAAIDFFLELPEASESIYADREKIEVILFNLLANAFKFTATRGMIRLKLHFQQDEVQFLVEDNGCGVPYEYQKDLFEKFARHAHGQQSGFGIGLYLSKKFAEQHAGTLCYFDRTEKGSAFILSLPRGREHLQDRLIYEDIGQKSMFLEELLAEPINRELRNSYVEKKPMFPTALVSKKPLMMIIDDNMEIVDYLYRFFEQTFSLTVFNDAEKALVSLLSKKADIVLCDVMMPGMSGLQFMEEMKKNRFLRKIPVILLTASTSEENKLKGIETGADDYISKPFNEEHLRARVQALLKQKEVIEEDFYDEITLSTQAGISEEEVAFLQRCENIILAHLHHEYGIKELAIEIGMSHSALYKKIKSVSGRTANEFMRFVKLRKAAQTLLKEEVNISEVTIIAGFNDVKYFREQFQKEFGMTPSEYVKKYRAVFQKKYQIS